MTSVIGSAFPQISLSHLFDCVRLSVAESTRLSGLDSELGITMQLTCPDCQVECTFDEQSAATVSCPGCGVLLYSKSGNSGPLAAQLAIAGGQRVEITNEDLEKTRQWQKSIDDVLPVPDQFPQRLGRYELKQKLGEGSFAEVYLAFDTGLSRDVALKIPKRSRFSSAEQLRRFLDEGRTSAILEHPGIVRVYDIGWISDEICFISMEYCPGGSLSDRLKTDTPTCDQAVELVESLADAIHFAHVAGFVHRDLKPSNVMIGRDGRPRIVDFGLALSDAEQLDHAGEVAGTLPYMSPEQIRGDAHHLDGRTDIWSLGVILYQMLVGRRPFSGTKSQIFEQIRNRDAKPLRQIKDELPAELENICLRCLKKSPDDRYRTAKDLAKDLHDFRDRRRSLTPTPVVVSEPESAPKRQPSSKSQLIKVVMAALVLLAGVGALVWLGLVGPGKKTSISEVDIIADTHQFSGPSLIHQRWYPLLDRKPNEIYWPSSGLPWRYDEKPQTLSTDNRFPGVLELGSTDCDNIAIELVLSKSEWTGGTCGVFWGLHESADRLRGAMISFDIDKDEFQEYSGFKFMGLTLARFPTGELSVGRSVVGGIDIERPRRSENRLHIKIGKFGPYELEWNGQRLEGIGPQCMHFWSHKYQTQGRFGVFNERGATAFRDVRFRSLK